MAQLGHLPIELLAIITAHLNGCSIGRLWLSGNPSLNQRLALGAVERFDLEISHKDPCKWPALVSRFQRLKYLRVVVTNLSQYTLIHEVDLASISSSLEHLELEFKNAESCLFDSEGPVWIDAAPDPVWSPVKEGNVRLHIIKELFPQLRYMRLNGWSCLGNKFLKTLPDTLLTLALDSNDNDLYLGALPPNLTEFRSPRAVRAKLDTDTPLPPGLIHFEFGSRHLQALPQCLISTVTHLRVQSSEANWLFPSRNAPQSDPAYDVTAQQLLPPSQLVHLDARYLPITSHQMMQQLPRTLTHLRCLDVTENSMGHLPPHLQYLRVDSVEWLKLSVKVLATLPATLTTLKIRRVENTCLVSLDAVSLLPRALRTLSYRSQGRTARKADEIQALPPNLTRLSEERIDPDAFPFLPPSLVKLAVVNLPANATFWNLRDLSHLTVIEEANSLQEACILSLPKGLTVLKLPGSQPLKDSHSALLPRTLRDLFLQECESLTDKFIEHLPPDLETLHLDSAFHLSDVACQLLPRGLRTFVANKTSKITDAGIVALPRFLRDLRLERTLHVTDNGVPLLPRGLTRLFLDAASSITDNAAIHFPRGLTSLDLYAAKNVTEKCAPQLPPLLEYYRCYTGSSAAKSILYKNRTQVKELLANPSN